MTTLAVLPTCWLRDLTVLSYISGKYSDKLIILCELGILVIEVQLVTI